MIVAERGAVKIFTPMGIFMQQITTDPRERAVSLVNDKLCIHVMNNYLYMYSKKQVPEGYEII